MKILIGEISSYKAIVIARHIKYRYESMEIIGYDYKKIISYYHTKYIDKFVRIENSGNIGEYIINISEYIKQQHIDVFIPVHSDYIGKILFNKHLFGSTLDYYGSFDDYQRLHNKNVFLNIAKTAGVRTPFEYKNINDAVIPFVIKPTNLSSAKGVHYCKKEDQRRELFQKFSNNSDIIIEEYICGKGCGYEMYCQDGVILCSYSHLRIAEYPTSGGSSVYRQSFFHPDMAIVAKKILEKIKWTGFLMLEFKLTIDNKLVLIEANPRVWGSINQALENNCNLFDLVLCPSKRRLTGIRDTSRCNATPNVNTFLSPYVFISIIKYAFMGKLNVLKTFIVNCSINKSDISFFNDPMGWLSVRLRKLF